MNWDKISRAAFVALAVGLGWGIRGDFGSVLGAMYPGAALGLAFAYVSGQTALYLWLPLAGAVSALGISIGGEMSYGLLHGYAKADSVINYSYGFFTLFLQGGAWGCFGGALFGLLLERDRLKATELFGGAATVILFGWLFYHFIVNGIGFLVNPYRTEIMVGYVGGVIALFVWLCVNRRWTGLRGAFFGFIGFGLGMSTGRFLGNLSYLQPLMVNHWNIMEVSCGLIGGFIFTLGMLGPQYPEPPEDENVPLLNVYSPIFILGFIPLLHRLDRIKAEEKLPQWTETLTNYGYQNAEFLAYLNLQIINGIIALSIVLAIFWIVLYRIDPLRYTWFPIISLSLIMLLIQNFNALYYFYPFYQGINMHNVLWLIFAAMVLHCIFKRHEAYSDEDDYIDEFPWLPWLVTTACIFIAILVLSYFVNGEATMASANYRFPLWSWRGDSPPPDIW